MIKIFDILLELENKSKNLPFSVSQNDLNAIRVNMTILNDGIPLNIAGTTSARIAIKKPSGLSVIQDCEIVDSSKGKISVILSTQAYAEIGKHDAEIYLYEGDTVSVTSTFSYTSKKAILDNGTVTSTNDWQSINDALIRIENADVYTKSEADVKLAEKAKQTDVNNALVLKSDKTYVDTQLGTTNATVALKADKSYVDTQLADKATQTSLNTTNANVTANTNAIGLKADKTYVDAQLAERVYKSVKLFGAKGDGTTDDTVSIQTALNSGYNIFFPNGTYISTQINVPSNVSLLGSGNSIIKAKAGMGRSTTLVRLSNVSNVTFDNIAIDGNSSVNTDGDVFDGISIFYASSCTNIKVLNVRFQNNIYAGSRWADCTEVHVNKCSYKQVDAGVWVSGTADRFFVRDCVFDGHNNSEPITFYGNALMQNIEIIGNIIKNKPNAIGINLGYEQAGFPSSLVKNVIVKDNLIENTATAIGIWYGENVIISNNKISSSGFGIRIQNVAKQIVIESNIIQSIQRSGISVVSPVSVSELTIRDNRMKDCNILNDAGFVCMLIRGSKSKVKNNIVEFTSVPSLLVTTVFDGVTNSEIDVTGINGNVQLINTCANNIVRGTLNSLFMDSRLNNQSIDNTTFLSTNDVDVSTDYLSATAFNYISMGNCHGNKYIVVTPSANGQLTNQIPLYKKGQRLTLFVDFTNSSKTMTLQRTGNIKYTADIPISADTIVDLVSTGTFWRVTNVTTV